MVYLDNAATTFVSPAAARAAMEAMTELCGNPSSTHAPGRAAKAALEKARGQVAAALGCGAGEVVFTSCGTEADNWAVAAGVQAGRRLGKHVVTTAAEHDAVLRPLQQLTTRGYEVTFVSPGKDGAVSAEDVLAAVRPDTALVSVMLVNNETGAINPVSEISRGLRSAGRGALFHTDAVQGFLKLPFTPAKLGVDLLSVSGHKIHAPKGSGALYVRSGLHLQPFLQGGGQERGLRSGTEAVPALCAFGAAAEEGAALLGESRAHITELRRLTESLLARKVPQARILVSGGAEDILSLSLPGYRSEVLLNCLDADGVCVSRSSACRKGGRSHVLEAMGVPSDVIDGAIRVSFSRYNTPEDVTAFLDSLAAAAARLRHR